jgi:hypothetical protein
MKIKKTTVSNSIYGRQQPTTSVTTHFGRRQPTKKALFYCDTKNNNNNKHSYKNNFNTLTSILLNDFHLLEDRRFACDENRRA